MELSGGSCSASRCRSAVHRGASPGVQGWSQVSPAALGPDGASASAAPGAMKNVLLSSRVPVVSPGWKMRTESEKAKSTAKRSHSLEKGKVREAELVPHVYRAKAARGTSCYAALRFQTEKLLLNHGREEQSNRETLGCHPEQ